MRKIAAGALAALLASAALASTAAAGPTVTVRVEGDDATLLGRTAVTLPDSDSAICGAGKRWTVADAIDVATGGNWDRQPFTQSILGESHTFADNDYWALWNGRDGILGYSATEGICDRVMQAGDEALMLVDRSGPAPDYASTAFPLGLRGLPAGARAGAPVHVDVVLFAADGSTTPVQGATVAGGGASALTGADGGATLVFPAAGTFSVRATKPGVVPAGAERVTVTSTTAAVAQGGPVPEPPAAVADATAPVATISGLRDGKVYRRRHAPRRIAGSVSPDPSGLLSVRLSIARKKHGRCWAYGGDSERFRRHRCGGSRSFRLGADPEWSYLLPKRLPRGRFAIRAVAIDRRGNASATTLRIRVR
jgi:hypothetical protein